MKGIDVSQHNGAIDWPKAIQQLGAQTLEDEELTAHLNELVG